MDTFIQPLWSHSDSKEDDPCDDWSGHPIPKPQKEDNK